MGVTKAEIAERAAQEAEAEGREVAAKTYSFHYVSDIPTPPEPYIAHPYTLLQTRGLIGRQRELNLLTDWITRPETMGHAHVMNVVAFNVLAQLERDASDSAEANAAASRAFELAWCDRPPFAYHWGLEKAKAHLGELGAPEPELEPFDASKFEPMPEAEIDPLDELGVGGEGS